MQRGSDHGGTSDTLVKILRQTCYAESAVEVAELLRSMLQTYHRGDRKRESDGDGDQGTTDDALTSEVTALSDRVFRAIPTAHRVGTDADKNAVYEVKVGENLHRFAWREMLARGSYNHVFYAGVGDRCDEPGVVKITIKSEKDLRVYLMENVLHAILYALPETTGLVVPLKYAFKLRKSGHPPFRLGTVMEDPGGGDFGGWIEHTMDGSSQMFAALAQVAWVLHRAQKAVSMQHRDLKVDNIMVTRCDNPTDEANVDARLQFSFPTNGVKLLLIDFGMARIDLGEYIACDCMHTDTRFNPSQDLQNLCLTISEDYDDELVEKAPEFRAWLKKRCAPLRRQLHKTFPHYDDMPDDCQHEQLSYIVHNERLPEFIPQVMLRELSHQFKK